MRAPRAPLALALCLVLILQITTILAAPVSEVFANNVEGEWTGTIDKVVDWTNAAGDTEDYNVGGDITFTVEGGRIFGNGIAWVEYTVVVKNGEFGDCYFEGRRDNLAFEFSGDYDEDTGKADMIIHDPPYFYDDEPTHIPGSREANFCKPGGLFENYLISPFSNSYRYPSFDLFDGATVVGEVIYGDAGYNHIVIHGPIVTECPELTITPIMPPAYDPRNLAGPTDTVSYRFEVVWEGKTPAKVYFDVQGGSGSVNPTFSFNPANMQSSPISVLMEVTTDGAEEGDYSFTIDAWIIDSETGEECHAEQITTVTLVVGESRAADLPLVKRAGQVEIAPEQTDNGGQNVVIETGNDGAVTFIAAGTEAADDTVSVTTIDIGSNTAIKEYGRIDGIEQMLEDKAKTAEAQAWTDNDLLKYKSPSAWEAFKSSIQEYVRETAPAAYTNILSCLVALDANTMEICTNQSWVYVSQGELHLHHKSAIGKAADRLMAETEKQFADTEASERAKLTWDKLLKALATPNALIIPNGTEITVNVQQSVGSSMTSVTVLESSALVVDLVSEEIRLVNAGERYSMETSFAGQTASSTNKQESISSDSILHWWILQVVEHATFKEWVHDGVLPANRTVFSGERVDAWVKFLSGQPGEHEIKIQIYRPDGLLYSETFPFESTGVEGYLVQTNSAVWLSSDPRGRWTFNIYADGYLVDEIPFYYVEYSTIDKQSATYALEVKVEADDPELRTAFANGMAAGFSSEFASMENVSTESAADIEWIKATIRGDSSTDARIYPELKVKNYPTILGNEISLLENNNMLFAIPTVGLDNDFAIPTTGEGEGFPSELIFAKQVDVDVGGSIMKAYEFTGSKKLAQGASSSELTITADYEKHTGMLVNYIASGKLADSQLGNVDFTLDLKATEMSIPTALTISYFSGQISQNQYGRIIGKVFPAVDDGQVVLTYQRNGNGDEPIKRTVRVTNGTFLDDFKMDKDGMYTVSAEYLGSGAYLSSTGDVGTLTVTPSECLIATAAFGSELTPQVQFLRNFRDNHILSTAAGSSFMNIFNLWYYSFSPSVADYEREQPWLQQTVKAAIYPLLGILTISEKAYASMPGEYGAVTAGIVASSMIGAVYFWPAAFAAERFGKQKRVSYRVMTILVGAGIFASVISVLAANSVVMMITTSFLVLTVVTISALSSARLIRHVTNRIIKK